MKNIVKPQLPAAPKNPEVNAYLKQAVVLIMTTGISWLDLRLGITILLIKLLMIFWSWRRESKQE